MVAIVVRPRTDTDEQVVALLRRFAAGGLDAGEVATALFELAEEADGDITGAALHIAAEATTDDDLAQAGDLWLELLRAVDGDTVTSSTGVTEEPAPQRFPERSRNITDQVKVPA
jgi:hypothetical protein